MLGSQLVYSPCSWSKYYGAAAHGLHRHGKLAKPALGCGTQRARALRAVEAAGPSAEQCRAREPLRPGDAVGKRTFSVRGSVLGSRIVGPAASWKICTAWHHFVFDDHQAAGSGVLAPNFPRRSGARPGARFDRLTPPERYMVQHRASFAADIFRRPSARHYRERRPSPSGIHRRCSCASELAQFTESRAGTGSRILAARLRPLSQRVGMTLPVYIIVHRNRTIWKWIRSSCRQLFPPERRRQAILGWNSSLCTRHDLPPCMRQKKLCRRGTRTIESELLTSTFSDEHQRP